MEAATPAADSRPLAPPTSRKTPTMPATAPATMRPLGRSATSSQANPAMASGLRAITEAATLEGSSWAATYTRRKKAPTFRFPSTAERHHQTPRGSVRAIATRTSPAGSARRADPQTGASAGNSWRVTT